MKKITLVLGGIRSGKSFFAETLAEKYDRKPVYVATMMSCSCDQETAARIACHQTRRSGQYETIEAPYELTGVLDRFQNRTVLVDCLTLNLSNRLTATEEYLDLEELIESDEEYLLELQEIIVKNNLNVIFVSNEVGHAPVEMNTLGRFFQDLQGRWNRTVAAYADEVYMVEAGIPRLLKKEKRFPFRVSCPSYVLPTGYVENVTYALGKVDDVQLLAFDWLPEDPLFKEETLSTLRYLAADGGLTYSLHMPVNPKVFVDFEGRLQSTLKIIEKTESLNISAFTFHYDLPEGKEWKDLKKAEIKQVDDCYIRFFKAVKAVYPQLEIALENTASPLSALDKVVNQCGLSYAVDLGHLHVQGWGLAEVESRLQKASVVHLHGIEETDGKMSDHRQVTFNPEVFKLLETFTGILTIENYHKFLFENSLKELTAYF